MGMKGLNSQPSFELVRRRASLSNLVPQSEFDPYFLFSLSLSSSHPPQLELHPILSPELMSLQQLSATPQGQLVVQSQRLQVGPDREPCPVRPLGCRWSWKLGPTQQQRIGPPRLLLRKSTDLASRQTQPGLGFGFFTGARPPGSPLQTAFLNSGGSASSAHTTPPGCRGAPRPCTFLCAAANHLQKMHSPSSGKPS